MSKHLIKARNEVNNFLNRFSSKSKIWGIVLINREKNQETLKTLGITPKIRSEIINSIKDTDYIETIFDEALHQELWVFGKDFNNHELYIKISIGIENSSTICISFHIAEYKLEYAFR